MPVTTRMLLRALVAASCVCAALGAASTQVSWEGMELEAVSSGDAHSLPEVQGGFIVFRPGVETSNALWMKEPQQISAGKAGCGWVRSAAARWGYLRS